MVPSSIEAMAGYLILSALPSSAHYPIEVAVRGGCTGLSGGIVCLWKDNTGCLFFPCRDHRVQFSGQIQRLHWIKVFRVTENWGIKGTSTALGVLYRDKGKLARSNTALCCWSGVMSTYYQRKFEPQAQKGSSGCIYQQVTLSGSLKPTAAVKSNVRVTHESTSICIFLH